MLNRLLSHFLLIAVVFAGTACGKPAAFVWFSSLPATQWNAPPGAYVIGVGDSIDIKVYDQENLALQGRVRSDGRMAMPLVGEMVIAGKQPVVLAREIETRLKQFIVTPRVTVNVTESVPISVSVLGEVASHGTLVVQPPATLVNVLAQSGGLTDFADKDAIYVLRHDPGFQRIRFTYDALLQNQGGAATFRVRTGDVVVVE